MYNYLFNEAFWSFWFLESIFVIETFFSAILWYFLIDFDLRHWVTKLAFHFSQPSCHSDIIEFIINIHKHTKINITFNIQTKEKKKVALHHKLIAQNSMIFSSSLYSVVLLFFFRCFFFFLCSSAKRAKWAMLPKTDKQTNEWKAF